MLTAGPACRFILSAEDSEADAGSDAAEDCLPETAGTGPFAAPTPIGGAFDPGDGQQIDEDDPSLTADLLEMYFDSNRHLPGGDGAIWVSKRVSICDDWEAPERLRDLSLLHPNTSDPAISPDGLTLWFATITEDPKDTSQIIYVTTRVSRDTDAWAVPQRLSSLSSNQLVDGPGGISSDGRMFVLSSNRLNIGKMPIPTQGVVNIFIATRTDTQQSDSWQLAYLDGINTECDDEGPHLSEDGRALVWSSPPAADECNADDRDLFIAVRADTEMPFIRDTELQNDFSEVNQSDVFDSDPWLSADGSYLVLSRGAPGEARRIYHTSRTQQ
ncbi:MAG: hypothetical protein AAGC55_10140 [Myxococcota bacterium]